MEAEADYGDGYDWAADGEDRAVENVVCCHDAWASAEWPIVVCDQCEVAWHWACLDPPLCAEPSDEHWYCPSCWVEWQRSSGGAAATAAPTAGRKRRPQ